MIAFPEVQRRAQAEVDAVVGRDRLPDLCRCPSSSIRARNPQRNSSLASCRAVFDASLRN